MRKKDVEVKKQLEGLENQKAEILCPLVKKVLQRCLDVEKRTSIEKYAKFYSLRET